jgi:hypothetical protein
MECGHVGCRLLENKRDKRFTTTIPRPVYEPGSWIWCFVDEDVVGEVDV